MANQDNTSTLHFSDSENMDYYSILQCNSSSTLDELKKNYRELIKICHPDKQNQTGSFYSKDHFIIIDKAFKTLSDEKLRKEYDAFLLDNSFKENSLIYAELSKSDLNFNSEGLAYFLCRCGHNIEISDEVLKEKECLVECSECTNSISIN